MTLLELVKAFCARTGLTQPSVVATSTDDQVIQIQGLLNEILEDLTDRKTTTFLTQEALHIALALEDQGAIKTIASKGFMHKILNSAIFNRTTGEYILGPVSSSDWQSAKAGFVSIAASSYRIRTGKLLITPVLTAGDILAFEYKSSYVVTDAASADKVYFTADTDTCKFPDAILLLGLRWIWKREKGLRYSEEFRSYENKISNLLGSEGNPVTIDVSEDSADGPILSAATMNWSL